MKFKVYYPEESTYWVWDKGRYTGARSEAFVFDTDNKEHMKNFFEDFMKSDYVLKLVRG